MFKYVVYSNGRPCDEYGYDLHEAGTHHSSWSASNYLINWLGYKGVDNLNKEFPIDTIIETVDISGEVQLMEIKKVWLSKEEILENMKEYTKQTADKSFHLAALLIEQNALVPLVESAALVESNRIKIDYFDILHDVGMTLNKMKDNDKLNARTYIVRNPLTGLLKIGKSTRFAKRIKELSTMNGTKLEVVTVFDEDIEHELHLLFKKYRKVGEWFEDSDGVIHEYIEANS